MDNCSPGQISTALDLFILPDSIIEIRALGLRSGGNLAGYFSDKGAAWEAACQLSGRAEGVYVTLNPVNPELLARRINRIGPAKVTTSDNDVLERRWWVIDVDPKRPKGISSNREEHRAALNTAIRVRDWINNLTGCNPVTVNSGNGIHLLYQCATSNSPEARDKLKDLLRAVANRFNDEFTDIDVAVFNAARIIKIPGTMACKGDPTPERPHRISRIIHNSPKGTMTLETWDKMLEALAQEHVQRVASGEVLPPAVPEAPRPRPHYDTTNMDVVAYFQAHEAYGRVVSEESGISTVLCPWEKDHSSDPDPMNTDTIIFNGTDGRPPGFKCLHSHCVNKRLQDILVLWTDAEQFGARRHEEGQHDYTDEGNVNRLIGRHQEHIRYCGELGGWLTWSGSGRWEPGAGPVMDKVREMIERMTTHERLQLVDPTPLLKHILTSRKKERMEAIPKLAASRKEVRARANQFDMSEYLLNTPNAVVDLRTGAQHRNEPHHYCTRQTNVMYDPTATCPRFDVFMAEVFRQDEELIDFVWNAIGYSLTGSVKEQVLFFCYGNGSNGKSTLLEVLRLILGDYAGVAAPGLLIESKSDRHPTEVADLRGKRLVYCVETGEGKRLAEELVKRLTGGDQLKARLMRQDFFSFDPTHKLWLSANHKPVIRGNDHAIWRRIPVIPFNVIFKNPENAQPGEPVKDLELLDKLKKELPGILAKSVRYSRGWFENGLKWPEAVKAEVKEYRDEMDTIGQFIEQRCEKREDSRETAADLYRSYREWSEENGLMPFSQTRFGIAVVERGVRKVKTHGNIAYVGLRIIPLAERTVI